MQSTLLHSSMVVLVNFVLFYFGLQNSSARVCVMVNSSQSSDLTYIFMQQQQRTGYVK